MGVRVYVRFGPTAVRSLILHLRRNALPVSPVGLGEMQALRNALRPLILSTLFLLGSQSAVQAQVGKLLPGDEAAQDPELFAFRARLQAAVARHDVAAVLEVVDSNIKNTFGGDDGLAAFRRLWKLDAGDDSRLWDELGLVLALGGSFQHNKDTFVAPYVFSRWPEGIDPFQHVAVLGTRVRVRAEPKSSSPVLTALSFDIVRLADGAAPGQGEWTAIKLRDGRTGYISSRYIRSSVAHRAFLTRKDGQWRLSLFVAGD